MTLASRLSSLWRSPAAVYLAAVVLSRAGAFLLIPLYTRRLTLEEYGQYALFLTLLAFLSTLIVRGPRCGASQSLLLGGRSRGGQEARCRGRALARAHFARWGRDPASRSRMRCGPRLGGFARAGHATARDPRRRRNCGERGPLDPPPKRAAPVRSLGLPAPAAPRNHGRRPLPRVGLGPRLYGGDRSRGPRANVHGCRQLGLHHQTSKEWHAPYALATFAPLRAPLHPAFHGPMALRRCRSLDSRKSGFRAGVGRVFP